MVDGLLNCLAGNFVNQEPMDLAAIFSELVRDMPGDGLALTVRI